jgi:hypothetical protein
MSNWWANKVGAAQPAPQIQPRQVQPQQPQQQPYQPQNYPPVQQQPAQGPLCPECRSANYGGMHDDARGMTAKARCYDCGYPVRQSASGVGKGIVGQKPSGGPVEPSRQISQGSGYNPQTFIGHI